MEFVELKKHLKTQKPNACYMCYGDDDFLVDRAVALLIALAGEPKPFNCVDKEFERGSELIDELMQLPVMSEYRVVVARGKPDMTAVSDYLKAPSSTSVLVLPFYTPHDSWNKASVPAVPSGATPVDCNRLPLNHVVPFVTTLAAKTNAQFDSSAIKTLYDRCGGYMTRIDSETQKLAVLKAGGSVTADDVTSHVKADTEFVVFELCDSILAGNSARALDVVDGMAKNNDLVAAFTLIYNRFRKLFAAAVDPDGLSGLGVKPYQAQKLKAESSKFSKARLKKILDMLENADYGYKTGATTVYDALTCFVAQAAYGRNM
ncbi:MAG: DNA polymerase III subunit delta [Clostridiales bacterium]|nr:DNA polymerase III subunit delta [Clostridiales bacterium]